LKGMGLDGMAGSLSGVVRVRTDRVLPTLTVPGAI